MTSAAARDRSVDGQHPPDHRAVLHTAVAEIGGAERPGQIDMADAIAEALETGRHLLVQAGTGTGKSLGYLAPALIRLVEHERSRIVVATATLALQRQLATKDIPAALDAVLAVTGKRPRHAILKGRTNYACRLKVSGGVAEEQGSLLGADEVSTGLVASAAPTSVLAAEVLALRTWADDEHRTGGLADRDDAPSHTERAWQQVSIPVRECLGRDRCPLGDTCFVEKSRDVARAADLVVTNHALLAIDAMHGGTALPEHDAVIIDEAHELVARVTGAASAELSPQLIERVGRRALPYLADETALELLECADALRSALDETDPGRVEDPRSAIGQACETVRVAARKAVSGMTGNDGKAEPEQRQAAAAVKEVFDVAERLAAMSEYDVIWVAESERDGRDVRVAPLTVAGLMRSRVFGQRTTVLTSATLKLGGDFDRVAASVGLRLDERDAEPVAVEIVEPDDDDAVDDDADDDDLSGLGVDPGELPQPWHGLDVGSPFDYRRQGILYVARQLPQPGRDGLPDETIAEIAELVWAAGGRTLGLFSSRRAAETAAVRVRKELPKLTVLCQGDAQLTELTQRFVNEESASLFGTLSLWQGVDVPGDTCQLVIIDRIPFPRPDDPLMTARSRAVAEAGGNGFMSVAATHAALLLAQGAGRLIRRTSDRGMVAVLDPRLVTARYGTFLRASMPEMWQTTDREVAIGALRRLTGQS
ncbi:ATP-dependent DNA helicase [Microlunatus ginsengisoli]|uniref:DNA 5'-3' helicase n=2 Tax=Microlunatus ginsengisoli TaxID=363863 RepID=A0ABP7AX23_9ACTN